MLLFLVGEHFDDVSGNGIKFNNKIADGVTAVVRGKVKTSEKDNKDYAHVDSLALSLSIKKVRMNVSKVFNNNRILSKYSSYYVAICPLPEIKESITEEDRSIFSRVQRDG